MRGQPVVLQVAARCAAALALQLALWGIQTRTRGATTADLGWSLLVGLGAVGAGLVSEGTDGRRVVVGTLAVAWASRLSYFLLKDRVLAGRGEDGRYRALRKAWAGAAARNFVLLYLAQAVVAALFVVPIAAAMRGGPLDGWAVAGVVLWLAAVAGETVADGQLTAFRADPSNRGVVCRVGLWRYSRHPNYFFEWVHWWAYVLIGHAAPLTLVGPLMMFVFLFRVTGIPYTERQAPA